MVHSEIIDRFDKFASWIRILDDVDEKLWLTPISEDKWSVGEIVAHFMNWDKHLISNVIPAVKNGEGMEFPDFDSFNKKASNYAKSGISPQQLVNETVQTRENLVSILHETPEKTLKKHIPANGVSCCPRTGTPYSLIYIIKEFTDHDYHHHRQIEKFFADYRRANGSII